MWGIIPAAGNGTRIQPLAFSKELLPVGSRIDASGVERPRAVGEYVIERMALAGVSKICFVVSPAKTDILRYFGGQWTGERRQDGGGSGDGGPDRPRAVTLAYVVQNEAEGLCDAVFRALPLVNPDEPAIIGLPDTVWTPADALRNLPDDRFSFLLFPVDRPELFDAVDCDGSGRVRRILVKAATLAGSPGWVWGALKLPGRTLHALHDLWQRRGRRDEYIGSLVNAFIGEGGEAFGVRGGEAYVDVGTLNGYRLASQLLGEAPPRAASSVR